MRIKVARKQPNSIMCFACGLKNKSGIRASFYEMENDELIALFNTTDEHQGYPGIVHGGISSMILDETIGRAILVKHDDIWGYTVELNVKYIKPVPLCEEVRVAARITKDDDRFFEGTGEILLKNGEVAVTGYGKYKKLPFDKLIKDKRDLIGWEIVAHADDPTEIEYEQDKNIFHGDDSK